MQALGPTKEVVLVEHHHHARLDCWLAHPLGKRLVDEVKLVAIAQEHPG